MSEHTPLPSIQLPCILCVDDEAEILLALTRLFRREPFQLLTAASGAEGLAILESTENIGLIMSDYRMPEMTGSEFLKAAAGLSPDSYRIILTGYADLNSAVEVMNQGVASRFLTKPTDNDELRQTVRDGLSLYQKTRENRRLAALVEQQNEELAQWNANLKKRVLQQTAQLRKQFEKQSELQQLCNMEICNAVVSTFTDLLEQRDTGFAAHTRTVAALAVHMAEKLGLSDQAREEVRVAALLHNIGSLGLPDRLLTKSKHQMTPLELLEFRSHSAKGEAAVEKIEMLREVGKIIRHHHEAYDGGGYPDGLAGEKIPLGARIIALANWIENACSDKSNPFATDPITQRVEWAMGSLFDPALLEAARSALKEIMNEPPGPGDRPEEERPAR